MDHIIVRPHGVSLRALAAGLALTTCVLAQPALAQATLPQIAPPSRGELLPPDTRPETPRTTLTIDGGLERGTCALDNPAMAQIRVTLSEVTFVGAEATTGVDLAGTYQPYIGRELPLSVLCDIRARASAALAEAGYLAAVEIPEQRLTGGAAQLRVVLGRLTALRVRGEAGPSQALLARYLQPLVGQPVFNVHEAERSLMLADDIPGLDVRLSLRAAAGGQPGDLIGEVAVLRRPVEVSVNVQNYGSRALGPFGGLVSARLYDLTGMGDVTSLTAFSSADFSEQQTVQASHEMLVGGDGLRLGGQVTLGWARPTLGIAGFTVRADTLFAGIHAAYPFVLTQATRLTGSAGLDVVNQDVTANTALLSRDHGRTVWARLALTQTDRASLARRDGYTPFEPRWRLGLSGEVRQGVAILGANSDCRGAPLACIALNKVPSRVEQDPTALLLRAELEGEYRPVPAFAVVVRAQAQLTSDPLPAFEELTGGNYGIGRGYDPGAISGDRGVAATVEFRLGSLVPRGANGFAVQPYAFVDAARVSDRDPSQRASNPDSLASVGGGLRFAWVRGMQGDLAVAVPLHNPDTRRLGGQPRGDVRVLLSLTSRLLPWRF
ncbi:MAG: ShlB/FhaC/HecB family hemolysin secretion/activation protein [Alteraurantiacibacter sp.]